MELGANFAFQTERFPAFELCAGYCQSISECERKWKYPRKILLEYVGSKDVGVKEVVVLDRFVRDPRTREVTVKGNVRGGGITVCRKCRTIREAFIPSCPRPD